MIERIRKLQRAVKLEKRTHGKLFTDVYKNIKWHIADFILDLMNQNPKNSGSSGGICFSKIRTGITVVEELYVYADMAFDELSNSPPLNSNSSIEEINKKFDYFVKKMERMIKDAESRELDFRRSVNLKHKMYRVSNAYYSSLRDPLSRITSPEAYYESVRAVFSSMLEELKESRNEDTSDIDEVVRVFFDMILRHTDGFFSVIAPAIYSGAQDEDEIKRGKKEALDLLGETHLEDIDGWATFGPHSSSLNSNLFDSIYYSTTTAQVYTDQFINFVEEAEHSTNETNVANVRYMCDVYLKNVSECYSSARKSLNTAIDVFVRDYTARENSPDEENKSEGSLEKFEAICLTLNAVRDAVIKAEAGVDNLKRAFDISEGMGKRKSQMIYLATTMSAFKGSEDDNVSSALYDFGKAIGDFGAKAAEAKNHRSAKLSTLFRHISRKKMCFDKTEVEVRPHSFYDLSLPFGNFLFLLDKKAEKDSKSHSTKVAFEYLLTKFIKLVDTQKDSYLSRKQRLLETEGIRGNGTEELRPTTEPYEEILPTTESSRVVRPTTESSGGDQGARARENPLPATHSTPEIDSVAPPAYSYEPALVDNVYLPRYSDLFPEPHISIDLITSSRDSYERAE